MLECIQKFQRSFTSNTNFPLNEETGCRYCSSVMRDVVFACVLDDAIVDSGGVFISCLLRFGAKTVEALF